MKILCTGFYWYESHCMSKAAQQQRITVRCTLENKNATLQKTTAHTPIINDHSQTNSCSELNRLTARRCWVQVLGSGLGRVGEILYGVYRFFLCLRGQAPYLSPKTCTLGQSMSCDDGGRGSGLPTIPHS